MFNISSRKRTYVPGHGPLEDALIVGVGEQPGQHEVRHRRPFVGPAGEELTQDLHQSGIQRTDVYLTNVIKDLDAPLNFYLSRSTKGIISIGSDTKEYLQLLKHELSQSKAHVILAIGNVALWALCDRWGITKWRGSVIESTLLPGRKVIPILHPATVIPPKSQYLNKHLIVMDLIKVREESRTPDIKLNERLLHIKPTYNQVMEYLERCIYHGLRGTIIDYDIEVLMENDEVSCISLAISPAESMSIPFVDASGDYFTPDQEQSIWLALAQILEDDAIVKRGQNITFDTHYLLRKYGLKIRNLHDTMVAQRTLYGEYPQGLDFITSMYTTIPYYKADGKKWLKGHGGTWENFWRYNAMDSIATAEAHPRQMEDLERLGNVEAYNEQKKLIEPLCYIMEHGIKVDVQEMQSEHDRMQSEIARVQEELNSIAGFYLNPNSSKQVADYFYKIKGLKPYKTKGAITTDEKAMKRISRLGYAEAEKILEYRRLVKLSSTYLDVKKVDSDGRIRCSYNPVGTRFSRISSSKNIFGTGMNMQNWPHELMKFLKPDEGYIYYSLDLSQIENRIVAYVGRIGPMIEAFETGKDVHRLTAALIFGIHYDEISEEPGSATIGGGKHDQRFWGKKANHALNYGEGFKTFSLDCEIPEKDGKFIVERYHQMYPGVRETYHAGVRNQLAKDRILTNLFGRRTKFYGKWGEDLFKDAYSCIPQSSCGDKLNRQGVNYLYYNQDLFAPVELLTQIHDSVGFQIPIITPWPEQAHIIWSLKQSLETPMTTEYGRKFVVPADLQIGLNLCKKDGIEIKHSKFPATVDKLADALKESYEKLIAKS